MKKTLIVALMMVAGIAHAGDINLKCDVPRLETSTSNSVMKLSINATSGTGAIGTGQAKVQTSSDYYTLTNQAWEATVNRKDLTLTLRFLFGKAPTFGTCEVVTVENKI